MGEKPWHADHPLRNSPLASFPLAPEGDPLHRPTILSATHVNRRSLSWTGRGKAGRPAL